MFRKSEEKNALTIALEKRRAAGLPIRDLTVANPTMVGLPYERDTILAALADPRSLVYEPEPLGLLSTRQSLGRMHGVPPEHVLLTASTSEAYSMLLKLLCAPGDSILVPAPSYPLFGPLADLAGVRTVAYPLAYDGAWHVDFSRFPRIENARAIFIVSPNNPTGSVVTQAELDRFAEFGLPIVIDEVFDFYRLVDRPRPSTNRVPTFRMGGLSKLACLPQMKLAWTIGEHVMDLEHIADAFLSVGAPVQHACARLIAATEMTRQALLDRIRANLQHLRSQVLGTPLTVLDVEAGWYACVRLPRTKSEEAYVVDYLDRGLLVHPGHFFDFEDEAYVVISLIAEPSEFARSTSILIG